MNLVSNLVHGVTRQGLDFVQRCIDAIESRGNNYVEGNKCSTSFYLFFIPSLGLEEEGIYRKPGVISKATKLYKDVFEKGKTDMLDFKDEFEWDTKTIASAVKGYLSKQLGEPLLTFQLHGQFIESASKSVCDDRLTPGVGVCAC